MSKNIDDKDARLLAELDREARESHAVLGRRTGMSKEIVRYRIDRLIKRGIIVRFHTVINYCKLGFLKCKLYLRLTNTSAEQIEKICTYFQRHPKTEWVVCSSGRWEIIVTYLVHNVNEFDDEMQQALERFSEHIEEKAVAFTLYLAHQEREFLTTKTKHPMRVVCHTIKDAQERIDEIDDKILRSLANNARAPITEIAKHLSTTARVVQHRVRDLERKKIILAYKAHLNPTQLNRIFCKAILYLKNVPEHRKSMLVAYASSIPGATWPQAVLGAWDLEIDFEVESYDAFQAILFDLRAKFPDVLKHHEFCVVSKEYKLALYPNAEPEFLN